MKGDMYDDGTPNPLIVKCPVCGGIDITAAIGTGQVRYHCNGCNHTWFLQKQEITTGGPLQYAPPSVTAPSYSITTPIPAETRVSPVPAETRVSRTLKYGWVCPKCGKVYAPDVKECLNCNYFAHTTVSGQTNQSSSAETHIENVTATMGTQEKRVRQDGSLVIDKSWFPNLTKDSTVYAGGATTNWRKAMECEHCNQEGGANSNTHSK